MLKTNRNYGSPVLAVIRELLKKSMHLKPLCSVFYSLE